MTTARPGIISSVRAAPRNLSEASRDVIPASGKVRTYSFPAMITVDMLEGTGDVAVLKTITNSRAAYLELFEEEKDDAAFVAAHLKVIGDIVLLDIKE